MSPVSSGASARARSPARKHRPRPSTVAEFEMERQSPTPTGFSQTNLYMPHATNVSGPIRSVSTFQRRFVFVFRLFAYRRDVPTSTNSFPRGVSLGGGQRRPCGLELRHGTPARAHYHVDISADRPTAAAKRMNTSSRTADGRLVKSANGRSCSSQRRSSDTRTSCPTAWCASRKVAPFPTR